VFKNKTEIPITFRLALLYRCVYFMPVNRIIPGHKCNICGLMKRAVHSCGVKEFSWASAADSSICAASSWFLFKGKMRFVVPLQITCASVSRLLQGCPPRARGCPAPSHPARPRAFQESDGVAEVQRSGAGLAWESRAEQCYAFRWRCACSLMRQVHLIHVDVIADFQSC